VNKTRDKTILKKFGLRLKEVRKLKGMSQDDLALEADIEKSQVYRIENGLTNPTITSIINIAKALNIRPEILFATFE
jgi:transcriptional regulator with XRE-family HTH domain